MESKWNSLLLYLSQLRRGVFGTYLFLNNLFIFYIALTWYYLFICVFFVFLLPFFSTFLYPCSSLITLTVAHIHMLLCSSTSKISVRILYFLQVFKQITYTLISSTSSFVNKFPNILIIKYILTVFHAPTLQDWDRPVFQVFSLSSLCTKGPISWMLFQFFSWLLP